MEDQDFNIVLSKNRLARTVRDLYKNSGEQIPDHVFFDFEEIEKKTGTANQPTAKEFLNIVDVLRKFE